MTQQARPQITVVSPVYGSEDLIPQLCRRLHHALEGMVRDYEVILVFDCSPDKGWERIVAECRKNSRVVGVKLSRNFGQHNAITAGLARARGDWVVVMDCDLQDRPEEISRLYEKACEGFDVVVGQRNDRLDTFFKRLSSKAFHRCFALISGIHTDYSVANFGIYSRKVVAAVLGMNEPFRAFPFLVLWLGFNRAEVAVKHDRRGSGESGYTLSKLLGLASQTILVYSNRPLHLSIIFGACVSLGTLIAAVIYFSLALQGRFAVSGWASLILSIWFLSGVIIFFLGVIAVYVGCQFTLSKQRPLYVVDEIAHADNI